MKIYLLFLIIANAVILEEVMADEWAIRAGGTGQDKIRGLAVAGGGAIFVTGEFGQPGAGFGKEEVESHGLLDFVIAKVGPDGEFLWTATAGGDKIDRGYAVCLSGDGGCFVTGHFESHLIRFGEYELKSHGDYDGFVAKYDGLGKCLWAKRFGGEGYDYGHGIAPDRKGGCVVSGSFAASGVFGDSSFTHTKGRRGFLLRIDAGGKFRWAREVGAADEKISGSMSGHEVATDLDGNIYMSGFQRGGADFGNGVSLPVSKSQDLYVAKFAKIGEAVWATGAPGSNGLATSVAADGEGGCYIGGMFQGEIDFLGKTVTSAGLHDFYTAALDSNGEIRWLFHGGGEKTDYGLSLVSTPEGGCLVAGEFTEKAIFRAKGNTRTIGALGGKDSFLLEYGTDGEMISANRFGGADFDLCYAVGLTVTGDRIVSGAFRNRTTIGEVKLKSQKGNDIFIARIPSR